MDFNYFSIPLSINFSSNACVVFLLFLAVSRLLELSIRDFGQSHKTKRTGANVDHIMF